MRVFPTTLAIAAGLALPSDAAELTVSIAGASPATGQLLVGVCDDDTTFLLAAVANAVTEVDGLGQSQLLFDLAPGTYAVAVTYDLNGNGAMDRKALGLPAEPYAFSNNARATFGPPSFARAAFALPQEGAAITITLPHTD